MIYYNFIIINFFSGFLFWFSLACVTEIHPVSGENGKKKKLHQSVCFI